MTIKDYWVVYYTIVRKEIVRILRIWPQTLLPSAITASLYFLIFGKVVGARIGTIMGLEYINFIAPGLVIMAIINNSYANVVSSFYSTRFNHSIEEILVAPVSNHLIILGYISGGVVRGIFAGCIVTLVAIFFGALTLHIYNIFLVTISFVLCSALFALGGLLNGILAQKIDDTMIFPAFILTPLIYLGGVFYGLDALPDFWRFLAQYNPMFYFVDFFRFSFVGCFSVSPIFTFLIIIVCVAVLYSICWYLLSKGIRLKS